MTRYYAPILWPNTAKHSNYDPILWPNTKHSNYSTDIYIPNIAKWMKKLWIFSSFELHWVWPLNGNKVDHCDSIKVMMKSDESERISNYICVKNRRFLKICFHCAMCVVGPTNQIPWPNRTIDQKVWFHDIFPLTETLLNVLICQKLVNFQVDINGQHAMCWNLSYTGHCPV